MEPESIERTEHYCFLPTRSCSSCVLIKSECGNEEYLVCFHHQRVVSPIYQANGSVLQCNCLRPVWCDK